MKDGAVPVLLVYSTYVGIISHNQRLPSFGMNMKKRGCITITSVLVIQPLLNQGANKIIATLRQSASSPNRNSEPRTSPLGLPFLNYARNQFQRYVSAPCGISVSFLLLYFYASRRPTPLSITAGLCGKDCDN